MQSPFKLEGTLDVHFDKYEQKCWEVVEKVRGDIYEDGLVAGGKSIQWD